MSNGGESRVWYTKVKATKPLSWVSLCKVPLMEEDEGSRAGKGGPCEFSLGAARAAERKWVQVFIKTGKKYFSVRVSGAPCPMNDIPSVL